VIDVLVQQLCNLVASLLKLQNAVQLGTNTKLALVNVIALCAFWFIIGADDFHRAVVATAYLLIARCHVRNCTELQFFLFHCELRVIIYRCH